MTPAPAAGGRSDIQTRAPCGCWPCWRICWASRRKRRRTTLTIKVDKHCVKEIAATGGIMELSAELLMAVGAIYHTFGQRNPAAADAFRQMIEHGISYPDSPVFSVHGSDGATLYFETPSKA